MSSLYLQPRRSTLAEHYLEVSTEPDDAALARVTEDGKVTILARAIREEDRLDAGALWYLVRELRRPQQLLALVEQGLDRKPRPPGEGWRVTRLLLAVQRQLSELDRESDRFTRTLLLVLQARASLRAFAALSAAEASERRQKDAVEDLLDASAALGFFEPARLVPFLQWLVAVLERHRVRELIDELLPIDEPGFVDRLIDRAPELAKVVEALARAQRRQWFLGRYDLRGAGRLRPLLARLRFPRPWQTRAWCRWLRFVDLVVPRLFAGCVMGMLPFLLTDEAWRLAADLSIATISASVVVTALAVLGYLAYDRTLADPAGLVSFRGVFRIWLTGLAEAAVLAAGVQVLAGPSFYAALAVPSSGLVWNGKVFLASVGFSLGVGIFTQLIWQEKAVTAPP